MLDFLQTFFQIPSRIHQVQKSLEQIHGNDERNAPCLPRLLNRHPLFLYDDVPPLGAFPIRRIHPRRWLVRVERPYRIPVVQ